MKRNAIIMGAAGRDFHNFNTYFRKNRAYNVVAFTAAQIPSIEGRTYPRMLSGSLYPAGISIYHESMLKQLIQKYAVKEVFLSYSDLSNQTVMEKAADVISAGATFSLLGPSDTFIKSKKPVIAVCAVRTGAGKSPTSRFIVKFFSSRGYRVVVIRHPMPYGDLSKQMVQRFADMKDLELNKCTIEEREEYEPHIKHGAVVYAGVDYEKILRQAEKEADLILWDGGNNDFPFYTPDLHITIADPHRPGHEMTYYPGRENFIMADAIVISKVNTAKRSDVRLIENHIMELNPKASIIKAGLKIVPDGNYNVKGKRVIVVEDGPTLTHGGMTYGAGMLYAIKAGALPVDPRKYVTGMMREVYRKYPHIGKILPAMGYTPRQVKDLEITINRAQCDAVIDGSPIDLNRVMKVKKPVVNVGYEFDDRGGMARLLNSFESRLLRKRKS